MNKWVKRTLIALVSAAVLMALAYIVISRPFFVKTVLLPQVGKATAAEITAANVKFRPFSSLQLYGVSFQKPDKHLKGRIEELRCQYSAFSFITGSPRIDRIEIINAEGTLSLPSKVNGHPPPKITWKEASFEASEIAENQTAKFKLRAILQAAKAQTLNLKNARLQASGTADLALGLFPSALQLEAVLDQLKGKAGTVELQDRTAQLSAKLTASPKSWTLEKALLTLNSAQKQDLQAAVVGTGTITPFTADTDINISPVSSRALNLAGAFYHNLNFGNATAEYHARMTYDDKGNIALAGNFVLHNAKITSQELGLSGLPVMAVKLNHNFQYQPVDQKGRIGEFNTAVTMDGRQVFTITLDAPFAIQLNKKGGDAVAIEPSNIKVKVSELPLKLINLILTKPDLPRVKAGRVSLDLNCTVADQGEAISIAGPLKVTDLGLSVPKPDYAIDNVEVSYNPAISIDNLNRIRLTPATISVTADGKTALDLKPGLEYNLADKTGKYNIELERLTPQVAKLLPPRLLATTPVMQLDLRGHTNGTFNLANKQLTANFSSDLKKLQLAVRGYGPTLPVQGSLEGKAQFAKEVLTLRPTELTIDYVDADRLLVHLLANGQLSLPLTQKKNEIFVSSKGIDLQSLGGIVTAYTRREQADKTRKGPEPHDPRQEKQAPPPRKKPAKTIHALAHLDLNDLVFRDVTLQSCSGDVLMKDQRISTESLEMEINNASLKITGYLDLSRTPPVYSFGTSLGSLAFSPILRSLGLQAFSSMVNAKTQSLSVKAQGQGFKLSELQQSLAGDAELSMDLLSIKGWDKLAGFARDYNIPELKSLIFNKIHAKAEIADGRILLSDTRMSGKNLKINIEGIIGLDKTLDLSTNLAVGGDLANRLMERGYGAVLKSPTDGYRSLVMPIPINGPWNEPKVDFDVKDFMRETYEENLQDAGMSLLKELMQERDNAEEK